MEEVSNKFMCLICGKDFSDREPRKRQGALNLHKRSCLLKHYQADPNAPTKKEETCKHSWRLLNNHVPIEKRAVASGYVELCQSCQQLR